MEIVLCAKYPYGKAVKGSALIKISNPGLLYEPLTKYQPVIINFLINHHVIKYILGNSIR